MIRLGQITVTELDTGRRVLKRSRSRKCSICRRVLSRYNKTGMCYSHSLIKQEFTQN